MLSALSQLVEAVLELFDAVSELVSNIAESFIELIAQPFRWIARLIKQFANWVRNVASEIRRKFLAGRTVSPASRAIGYVIVAIIALGLVIACCVCFIFLINLTTRR